MSTGTSDQDRRLILTINCGGTEFRDQIFGGFFSHQVKEFYGYEPELVMINVLSNNGITPPWWVDPLYEGSLIELVFDVMGGNTSPNEMKKWVETPEFVRHVRGDINAALRDQLNLPKGRSFASAWREQVKLVILNDSTLMPETSPYVQRVFEGYFPAAYYWKWGISRSSAALRHRLTRIWRDES